VGGLLASAFCAWLFAADAPDATSPLAASDQRGK